MVGFGIRDSVLISRVCMMIYLYAFYLELEFYFIFHVFSDSISSNTIESTGIWLDHAEGLSLSQFFGERGFVSFTFCFCMFIKNLVRS